MSRLRAVWERRRPGWVAVAGVVAAAGVLFGSGWYQAFTTPPYRYTDEQAHAGYVLSVQRGHLLPSIDSPIPEQDGGPDLQLKLRAESPARHDVWVANDPPYPYLLMAGPAWVTRAAGLGSGPLVGDRLTNLFFAAVAVVATYLLGRELSGGDRRVGLVAAGAMAALPHPSFITSLGMTDGIALATSTAVLVGLARVCRRGPSRPTIVALGLALAASAAVRPMNLALAAVAGVLALAVVLWRGTVTRWWAAAWLAGPTVVTSGWFYLLNVHRYGDLTASQALFDKFGRVERYPSVLTAMKHPELWSYVTRVLLNRRLERPIRTEASWWFDGTTIALRTALFGVAVLVLWGVLRPAVLDRWRRFVDRAGTPTAPEPPPGLAWAASLVLVAANAVLLAQHWSGGGSPNARYLLPSVPVALAGLALVLVFAAGRLAGLALVLAAAWFQWGELRPAAGALNAGNKAPPGSALTHPVGPDLVRFAGLGLAALCFVVLCVAVLAPARRLEPPEVAAAT